MDANFFDGPTEVQEQDMLSYDDRTTYEEQVAAIPVSAEPLEGMGSGGNSLAGRIGKNKIYLPPNTVLKGKVRVVHA